MNISEVLVPVPVDPVSLSAYAAFPPELDRDWLGRICHLSEPDLALVRRRADPVTRLGYATQLVTVRTIGTLLTPTTVSLSSPGIWLIQRVIARSAVSSA